MVNWLRSWSCQRWSCQDRTGFRIQRIASTSFWIVRSLPLSGPVKWFNLVQLLYHVNVIYLPRTFSGKLPCILEVSSHSKSKRWWIRRYRCYHHRWHPPGRTWTFGTGSAIRGRFRGFWSSRPTLRPILPRSPIVK